MSHDHDDNSRLYRLQKDYDAVCAVSSERMARIESLEAQVAEREWIPVSERLPTGHELNGILLDVGDDVWFLVGMKARNKAEKDYAVQWFECPSPPQEPSR